VYNYLRNAPIHDQFEVSPGPTRMRRHRSEPASSPNASPPSSPSSSAFTTNNLSHIPQLDDRSSPSPHKSSSSSSAVVFGNPNNTIDSSSPKASPNKSSLQVLEKENNKTSEPGGGVLDIAGTTDSHAGDANGFTEQPHKTVDLGDTNTSRPVISLIILFFITLFSYEIISNIID